MGIIAVALVLLFSIMGGQAIPINGDSKATTSTSDDVSELCEMAKVQVYRIKQEITALEQFTVSILTTIIIIISIVLVLL